MKSKTCRLSVSTLKQLHPKPQDIKQIEDAKALCVKLMDATPEDFTGQFSRWLHKPSLRVYRIGYVEISVISVCFGGAQTVINRFGSPDHCCAGKIFTIQQIPDSQIDIDRLLQFYRDYSDGLYHTDEPGELVKSYKDYISLCKTEKEETKRYKNALDHHDIDQKKEFHKAYPSLLHDIIDIYTGEDGCWITFKARSGKNITFQPVALNGFFNGQIGEQAFKDWLDDRRIDYKATIDPQ